MIASKLDGYAAQLEDPTVREALIVERCQKDPATTLEEGVLAPLEKLPAPGNSPRYLLIDALDEALQRDTSESLVEMLASRLGRFPAWLRVVATTRKEREVLDRLRHLRAHEPLEERQLAAATKLDPEEELPRLLRRLSAYVAKRREEGGAPTYSAFHKSLTDWLTNPQQRGGVYYASPKRGHEQLAEACWREYQQGVRAV